MKRKVFQGGRALALVVVLLLSLTTASQAQLLDQYLFNESGDPYADSGANDNPLYLVPGTTAAGVTAGASGLSGDYAAVLGYNDPPGVSTSLVSSATVGDSFGFSFFIKPVSLSSYDNFIDESGTNNTSGVFQVHLLGDNGSGQAAIELAVRNPDGSGFAGVISTVTFSLDSAYSSYINIAGGYNAITGETDLFVNGVETTAFGDTGLDVAGGSQLLVGTDLSINTYAAGTAIDDLQLYGSSLTANQVDGIIADVPEPSSAALMVAGLLALLGYVQRRRGHARK